MRVQDLRFLVRYKLSVLRLYGHGFFVSGIVVECLAFSVLGLGFRVQNQGSGFRFWCFCFRHLCVVFSVQGLGFSAESLGFRLQGERTPFGLRIQGLGVRG